VTGELKEVRYIFRVWGSAVSGVLCRTSLRDMGRSRCRRGGNRRTDYARLTTDAELVGWALAYAASRGVPWRGERSVGRRQGVRERVGPLSPLLGMLAVLVAFLTSPLVRGFVDLACRRAKILRARKRQLTPFRSRRVRCGSGTLDLLRDTGDPLAQSPGSIQFSVVYPGIEWSRYGGGP